MRNIKSIVGFFALLLLLTGCVSSPTDDDGVDKSEQTIDTTSQEAEESIEEVDTQDLVLDDFPEGVFIPQSATLIKSIVTEEKTIMLTYEVPGILVDEQDVYEKYLTDEGYKINEINMSDQMIVFQGSKLGEHFLYYHLVGQEEDSYTLKIEYGKY